MFIGPFADDHFTAGNRTLGPEALHGKAAIDYNTTFPDGRGGTAGWGALPAPGASRRGAPHVVSMPALAAKASANKTVAVVLCTHVFVPILHGHGAGAAGEPGTVEVQLTGSTASLATITVNGAQVLNDRVATGLRLREFSRPANLTRGAWNEVLVKAQHLSWGAVWEMALSVHEVGGLGAVPGLATRY